MSIPCPFISLIRVCCACVEHVTFIVPSSGSSVGRVKFTLASPDIGRGLFEGDHAVKHASMVLNRICVCAVMCDFSV